MITSRLRTILHEAADAIVDAIEMAHAPNGEGYYVTDGPLPPRTSRETFNRVCRRGDVADAERIAGRGRGYCRCSRVAWHRARTKGPPAPPPPREKTEDELAAEDLERAGYRRVKPKTDAELADKMIARAGYRRTR